MSGTAGQRPVSVDYGNLTFLAAGKSGIVYGIDDKRVLKEYYDDDVDDMRVERRVLTGLGSHPNIIGYLGATHDGHAVLERGTSLHQLVQQHGAEAVPLDQKLRWAKDAATGLQYLHQHNIVHADVSCHNMVVVQDRVKLIDFEGCGTDENEASSCYNWFSYRQPANTTPTTVNVQTDIFAYGCAVYEIMTGRHPYQELATEENRRPRDLVVRLYANNQFPDVAGVALGGIIRACWLGTLTSMSQVLAALEAGYTAEASTVPTCQGDDGQECFAHDADKEQKDDAGDGRTLGRS